MEPEHDSFLLRLRNVPLMGELEVPRLHDAADFSTVRRHQHSAIRGTDRARGSSGRPNRRNPSSIQSQPRVEPVGIRLQFEKGEAWILNVGDQIDLFDPEPPFWADPDYQLSEWSAENAR